MSQDDAASLRALCQAANQQVAGWPPSPQLGRAPRGGTPAPRGKRLLAFGLLGASSVLALAFAAGELVGRPSTPAATLAASALATSPALPAIVVPLAEAAPAGPVQRQGEAVLIDFDRVPLPEAALLLARETRTTLHDAELLQPAVLVTLQVRARNVADAWKHVLQGRALFSIACPVTGCDVVIAGERSLPTAAAPRAAGPSGVGPDRAPAKVPTDEEISQPDGAC